MGMDLGFGTHVMKGATYWNTAHIMKLMLYCVFVAAKLFNLSTPTPFLHLQNLSQALQGINFAVGGAGVTYVYGITPLDDQVDNMEALVANGVLTKSHLWNSVGVISVGVNDYDFRNSKTPFQVSQLAPALEAFSFVAFRLCQMNCNLD